ncbi:1836_t:CDS:2, partial [Racocetra fulgida]
VKTLTLEKYISEVVVAVVEGVQKCKASADVWAAVEVISALHQRFPDTFTPFLTHTLARSLAPPNKQLVVLNTDQREREESSRILKQRVLLRIAGELWLIGVLRNVEDGVAALNSGGAAVGEGGVNGVKDNVAGFVSSPIKEMKEFKETRTSGEGFMYTVLKDLVCHNIRVDPGDVEQVSVYLNMNSYLMTTNINLREVGTAAPINDENNTASDRDIGLDNENEFTDSDSEPIVSASQRALFKNLLIEYFKGVETRLIKEHQ